MHKLIHDLLQNEKGFFSANMVMRWGSFVVLMAGSAWALYAHPELTMEVLYLNAGMAFGLSAARMWQDRQNRKTKDEDGPLMQAGTETAPADPVVPIVPAAVPKADEAKEIEEAV